MATGSNIRVGDAERDATATQLREHYATGRLTLDELNERLDQTFKARTGADLKAVTRDLPALGSPWAGATAAGGLRGRRSVPPGPASCRGAAGPSGGRRARAASTSGAARATQAMGSVPGGAGCPRLPR